MRMPILKSVALLVLAAYSSLALADVPARVGRISLTQGQVTIGGEVGEEANEALVNWPVTSRNQINTGRGARTEVRIGSTALRLDGDSAMDVIELDDDTMRLHLHYGSASIRVRSADVARGFELSTPQGRVRIKEPGRLRIDAERVQDTTVVTVFDGAAVVDDGGSSLTVRAGRRVELYRDDIRTALALRDSFDEWALLRDQRDDRATSDRYVTSEMTGYEDLDQYGNWREDTEYGPLWTPSRIPANWAPYRDGRWTYLSPWGWTWVDNAPWGYAPFHYGRWVQVNQRWCWAPGRNVGRPVWAPALVGWVGGSNWNLSFTSRGNRPAQGWYPLTPRDNFVPGYRASPDHVRYINRHVRVDNVRGNSRHPDDRRNHHHPRPGLTVVPHEQFGGRGQVVVPSAPRAVVTPLALQSAPLTAPPAPAGFSDRRERERDFERRPGRVGGDRPANERAGVDRAGNDSAGRGTPRFERPDDGRGNARFERDGDRPGNSGNTNAANNANGGNPRFERPVVTPAPAPQVQAQPQPSPNAPVPYSRRDGRFGDDERRVRVAPPTPMVPMERPVAVTPPPQAQPQVQAQPQPQPQPQVQFQPREQRVREERPDRFNREVERERRQPPPMQMPQPQQHQPQPQPQPIARPAPPPPPPQPQPQVQQQQQQQPQQQSQGEGRGRRGDGGERRQPNDNSNQR